MVHFLEQYEQATMEGRIEELPEFVGGCYRYALLFSTPTTTIRLVRATTTTPYRLVPHYVATHLMNFITTDYLLVAYPRTTFARRGLILVDHLPPSLHTSYVTSSRQALIQNGMGCASVLCGSRIRRFNDSVSRFIGIRNDEDLHVEDSIYWRLGGVRCGEECMSGGRVAVTY